MNDATYLSESFRLTIPDAEQGEPWYVCLMKQVPFYGGPEEGGWWGSDVFCMAAKQCFNKQQAERIAEQVKKVAEELSTDAHKSHGEHCLRTLDWLEARGLDVDYLPEPDGEETYSVIVSQGIPEPSYGNRRYE